MGIFTPQKLANTTNQGFAEGNATFTSIPLGTDNRDDNKTIFIALDIQIILNSQDSKRSSDEIIQVGASSPCPECKYLSSTCAAFLATLREKGQETFSCIPTFC